MHIILLFIAMMLSQLSYADDIVAVVNQNVILRSELDSAYGSALSSTRNSNRPTERQVLEELVNRQIQLDLADRTGIYVSEAEVQERAAQILKSQKITKKQQLSKLTRQDVTYDEWLGDIKDSIRIHKLQLQQLRSYVKVNESEVDNFLITNTPQQLAKATYDLVHIAIDREDIGADGIEEIRNLLESATSAEQVQKLVQSTEFEDVNINLFKQKSLGSFPTSFSTRLMIMDKGEAVAFTTDDLRHFLKVIDVSYPDPDLLREYKVSVISFMNSIIYNDEQVKVRIDDIYSQLQNGRNFSDLSAIYFTQNSPLQNYIGSWVVLEQLPTEVRTRVARLKPSSYSQPFSYAEGRHIVYLEESQVTDRTLQKWRNNAYQELANRKLSITLPFWLSDILTRSYVEYRI